MFLVPMSWKHVPWKQQVALAALVLFVTLVVLFCVQIGFTLHAIIRSQQHGEEQAFALAELEAQALNEFAATNRTIAATYVAMNHAHASPVAAPGALPLGELPVELLNQMMDDAHSFQCTLFAVTFDALRLDEASDTERTVGTINAVEFSRAMEGMPCGELDRLADKQRVARIEPRPSEHPEDTRAGCASREGCFMKFRAVQDSGHDFSQPRVYRYISGKRLTEAEEEKASLFVALVGYRAPDPVREPPSLFAPFWRAMLPEGSLRFMRTPAGLKLRHGPFETGDGEVRFEVARRATQGMPSYKGERLQALAADYLGADSSIAAGWFTTRDTPEAVLSFYREGLGRTGLPVLYHRYNANAGYVGYREPETQALHLVSVLAQGAETTVFISHASANAVAGSLQVPVPSELPLPDSVQPSLVLRFQAEGHARFTGQVAAPRFRVKELADFYVREFRAQGWSIEQTDERLEEEVFLTARRGPVRVSTLIQPRSPGARVYFTLDRP